MKGYFLFFLMVITIPVFLGINAWQSNKMGVLRGEIRQLERQQENLVETNRTIAADIADLLAVERIDKEAKGRLGMTKINPEDVTLIILGGEGNGR
jgi:cell division protein FtsL